MNQNANNHRSKNLKQGFTLIELLVVIAIIAIIAILAAILFPVFATAREKARQITGASNLKQIDLAMLQYLQDYDERFFPTVTEREGSYANSGAITADQALVFSIRGRLYPYNGILIYARRLRRKAEAAWRFG